MKAMSYLIDLKEGKFPELSIFISNYQNKSLFVFVNRKDGAFLLPTEQGKGRLNLVDKETTKIFDIDADTYLIFDLVDSLMNRRNDTIALLKKYLPSIEGIQKDDLLIGI